MGNLLRQYWMPFIKSEDLDLDGEPKRVKLLGEDLIAFRDTDGRVGLMAHNCPHRGASLFFGRNEEAGLRCVYHGWKFNVDGTCVDMPNEPAESDFKHKVRANAYLTHEAGGAIWAYMGDRDHPAPFPDFEVLSLPADHLYPPLLMLGESNWVQSLEGDLDSSHIDWLHSKVDPNSTRVGTHHYDRQPRFHVVPTDYGAFYSAARTRDADSGKMWHRITQFILPFYTMIAADQPKQVHVRAWVPLDDCHNLEWHFMGRLDRPVTEEEGAYARDPYGAWHGWAQQTSDPLTRYATAANIRNDFLLDRGLQKDLFVGVPFLVNLQDRVATEPMGPIYERWNEHLGTTDVMCIYMRRRLIDAARRFQTEGVLPANAERAELDRVRPASMLLDPGDDWIAATEHARSVDPHADLAAIPLIGELIASTKNA
jgi:nitrite reductase/ring-hydroxylating ferredoxin subunit